jgi:transcription initiation factor TFIIB
MRVSHKVQIKTIQILKRATSQELTSGRCPTSMAAAALYIASVLCRERITQREVAEIACVTEVTIRNRYKEIIEKLDINIYTE